MHTKSFIGVYVSWLKQTSAHLYNEVLNLKLKSFMSPFVMTWVNLCKGVGYFYYKCPIGAILDSLKS